MDITNLECKRCGAPLNEVDGKVKCDYCGLEVIIESKKIEDIGEKVKESIQSSGLFTQEVIKTGSESTQIELRRLQLSQELNSLQLQLSNLRSEKRRLSINSGNAKANRSQIREIEYEEKQLQTRIQDIHKILFPVQSTSNSEKINSVPVDNHLGNIKPMGGSKSQGVAFILLLTLGYFGAHRFYTGHKTLGFVYLLTFGLFGLGLAFDFILLITNSYNDSWGRPLTPMNKPLKKVISVFIIGTIILMAWILIDNEAPPIALIISYLIAAIIIYIDKIKGKLLEIFKKSQ